MGITVRKGIGILLLSFGHLINIFVLLAAVVYAFGLIIWMHAPITDVVKTIVVAALVPLIVAWGFRAAGRRTMLNVLAAQRLQCNTPLTPLSPLKKRLRIGVGVVATVAGIVLAWNAYTEFKCATDPNRFTPATKAEALKNGFTRACKSDVSRYDISFGSLDRAIQKLAFTPVDLTHTPFAAFTSLGGSVESITDVPARLYRGFQMPGGRRLTLSEHDMSADGVHTYRHPDDELERINGLRARLNVMEVKPGQAVSHLSWVEGRRSYELWMDANVTKEHLRAQLFALAASLPKSVPACPNEPPEPTGGTEWERFIGPTPVMQMDKKVSKMKNMAKRPCR
jgi:hypothetical protein